jgi:hypothetical protein
LEGSGPGLNEVLYRNFPGIFKEATNPTVKRAGAPAGVRILDTGLNPYRQPTLSVTFLENDIANCIIYVIFAS